MELGPYIVIGQRLYGRGTQPVSCTAAQARDIEINYVQGNSAEGDT
jgi:hypothetical protein